MIPGSPLHTFLSIQHTRPSQQRTLRDAYSHSDIASKSSAPHPSHTSQPYPSRHPSTYSLESNRPTLCMACIPWQYLGHNIHTTSLIAR